MQPGATLSERRRCFLSSHRDLAADVAAGRFRADLFYRLQVVEIVVPPLRDRREDILPLARQLLADVARPMGRPSASLTPSAADQLVRHAWPGNVRELENAMERAVALCRGCRSELDDLPEDVRRAPWDAPRTLDEVVRAHVAATLERHDGHQGKTAAELGISASTLYRMLRRPA